MAALTMKELLEAGVHFGHQTKRWNPKMQKYIFGERNGIYIIDLQKTLKKFREAYAFVRDLAAGGGTLLFIGTKKQAQDPVADAADSCGMPSGIVVCVRMRHLRVSPSILLLASDVDKGVAGGVGGRR